MVPFAYAAASESNAKIVIQSDIKINEVVKITTKIETKKIAISSGLRYRQSISHEMNKIPLAILVLIALLHIAYIKHVDCGQHETIDTEKSSLSFQLFTCMNTVSMLDKD